MKVVKENSTIDVDYEGRLEDGTLFDTSKKEVAEKLNWDIRIKLLDDIFQDVINKNI